MPSKCSFLFFLIVTAVMISGCISSPGSSIAPSSTTSSAALSIATITTIAATSEITNIPTKAIEIPNKTETTIPQVNTYSKVNPDTTIKTEPRILSYTVSNCVMKEVFPAIANDPNYGLKANPPKLSGISEGEWNRFIRDYMEGKNENSKTIGISRCSPQPPESPPNPYWNFNKISVLITPRNSVPTNYEFVIHLHSNGKEVGQVNMNETLDINQPIQIVTYIPMRNDETYMFDSPIITFNQ